MAVTASEIKKYKEKGRREVEEGLPGWFATFADMMTLLLAFFVLLAAISTIDPVKLQQMADEMGKSVGKKIKKKGAMNLADIEKSVKVMIQKENLQKSVDVTTSPKGVTIGIASDITFRSGSAEFQPQLIDILQKIIPTISKSYFEVAIEGHTDNLPIPDNLQVKFPSNWELSAARAAAVVRELIRQGVDPTRLQAVGKAEFVPRDFPTDRIITPELIRDFNRTVELQAKNRRVEIIFLATRSY